MDTMIVQVDLLDAHIQSLARLSDTLFTAMQGIRQAAAILNDSDSLTVSRLRADLLQKQKRVDQIDADVTRLRRALIQCRDILVETEQNLSKLTFHQPGSGQTGPSSSGAAGTHTGPHHTERQPFVTPRRPKYHGRNMHFTPLPPRIKGGRHRMNSTPRSGSWSFTPDMIGVFAEASVIFNMLRIFVPTWLDQFLG